MQQERKTQTKTWMEEGKKGKRDLLFGEQHHILGYSHGASAKTMEILVCKVQFKRRTSH